jgi:hypothetical protein
LELVPERLRGDDQAVAPQDALPPGERDVVEALVDGDLDGEVERVSSAGAGALRVRGLSRAAAALARYFCCCTRTTR